MEKKSDSVRRFVKIGKYKEALRIAKDFRLGIEKTDSEAMKLGYECIVHPGFYKQIGTDTEAAITAAIAVVKKYYA